MRKRLIADGGQETKAGTDGWGEWLDVVELAEAEISSEDERFPIEGALSGREGAGWRAAGTGPQTIRLLFAEPVTIRRIRVHFVETEVERGQEFAVFAQTAAGGLREVRRQQFQFSPGGSTEEIEEYTVELDGVTGIELKIDPDRAHNPAESGAIATLRSLRLG